METALLRGVAAALATAGIGTWSLTVPYLTTQVGIYDGPPGAGTVEAVGLTLYTVADPVSSHSVIGLQVLLRSATKAGVRDRAEQVFNRCHAAWGWQLPAGPRIDQMMRTSSADLGIDEAGAFRRTDNYYMTLNHPTGNRP